MDARPPHLRQPAVIDLDRLRLQTQLVRIISHGHPKSSFYVFENQLPRLILHNLTGRHEALNNIPRWRLEAEGIYNFQVFATGTANFGDMFARLLQKNVSVGLDSDSFTSTYQEVALSHNCYLPLVLKP